MAGRGKSIRVVLVLIAGGLLLAGLSVWLLRGTIATSIARGQLDQRGVTCDDRFTVSLNASLSEATIGPTRCTHEGGVVQGIELLGDLTVTLDGTEPVAIEAQSLRLIIRAVNVRGGDRWAAGLRRINLEQQVAGALKGLSELAGMDLPDTTVQQVEMVRGTATLGRARAVRLTPGDPLQISVQNVHFEAGPMGVGQLDLDGITGDATPSTVSLRGQARARAGVAIILTYERSGPFEIEATGLDSSAPRFRLTGGI